MVDPWVARKWAMPPGAMPPGGLPAGTALVDFLQYEHRKFRERRTAWFHRRGGD